jgi:integrase/recombinase XerD
LSQKLSNIKRTSAYDYDALIEGILKRMQADLSQSNTDVIRKYDKVMVSLSMSKAVRLLHLRILLNLSKMLGKDWKDVTRNDIDELVYKIMQKYASEDGQETNSSSDHKKILKIFFRWVKLGSRNFNEVGDPEETKRVKIKKVKDKIIREDLITEADLTRMLHACKENQRDRAFIDCQSEAGTRPGEMLNLLLRHVKFDNHGAILHVDGKTGTRTVRLIRSVPNLAKWLDVHPFRDNPESPLWIMLEKRQLGQMMSYAGARQIIKRRADIAGLSKRVYMNLFRHSEATRSATFLTEAQMRGRHGWSSSSRMPARYVHLVNADVDDAILSHYGIVKEEKAKLDLPKKCNVCDMMNAPESKRCSKCGKALDLKTAVEIDEQKDLRIGKLEEDFKEMKNNLSLILREIAKKSEQTLPKIN